MAILFIALFLFVLLTLGAGGLLFVVSRQRRTKTVPVKDQSPSAPPSGTRLGFRRRYVALPLAVMFMALAAVAYFFRLLPPEVGYRFAADGNPDGFLGRGAVAAIFVAPQLLLAFLAAAVAHVVAGVGVRFLKEGAARVTAVESIITVMSNMVVLPQIVLLFTMLDIFSYNAFQVHLVEPWIVALVVMLVGGPVLAIFFFKAIQQARAGK